MLFIFIYQIIIESANVELLNNYNNNNKKNHDIPHSVDNEYKRVNLLNYTNNSKSCPNI